MNGTPHGSRSCDREQCAAAVFTIARSGPNSAESRPWIQPRITTSSMSGLTSTAATMMGIIPSGSAAYCSVVSPGVSGCGMSRM